MKTQKPRGIKAKIRAKIAELQIEHDREAKLAEQTGNWNLVTHARLQIDVLWGLLK